MLQQAKLMKQNGSNHRVKPAESATTTKLSIEKKSAQSSKRSDDGLPFSDEIYAHLRYVIEKISGRMKNETPLTRDEIDKLKESIHAIMEDSKEELGIGTADEDDNDDIRYLFHSHLP